MKRAPRNQAIAVFVSAIGMAVVLFGFFVFRPIQGRIAAAREELQQRQLLADQYRQRQPIIATLQDEKRQVEQFITAWQAGAPKRRQVAERLSWISETARRHGVVIQRFTPQREVEGHAVLLCPVSLSLEGEFPQLLDFLQALDKVAGTTWTTELTVRPKREEGTKVIADIQLSIIADNRDFSG